MVPNSDRPASELALALAALEDALETPIVSGELTEWCERTRTAFETLRETYVDQARPAHAKQLLEIGEQDQEMGALVAQLTQEDQDILVEFDRLGPLFSVYIDHVDPKAEGSDESLTDESSLEEDRRALVQELLALVIRVRTHEKSLQTWFVEAFQRDRGVAD